jgi:hydroxymethylbilane synthase
MSSTVIRTLRIGTRRSALAMAQAQSVADALSAATGQLVDLVPVVTEGDRSSAALSTFGGSGVFVTEIRNRLLAGDIDVAVHSAKDLPAADVDGLRIAAVPPREDPRDALVAAAGRPLSALPAAARIGTGAPRRAAQLRALRADLRIVEVRGNVDTRLRRVEDGEVDAVVLALAGLRRLGRADAATQVFEPVEFAPAPGQGALAVECRAADDQVADLLAAVDHPASHAALVAERALLVGLGAGCSAPVGALASVDGMDLMLSAVAVSVDGSRAVRLSHTGPVAEAARIGSDLARAVLAAGAADVFGASS